MLTPQRLLYGTVRPSSETKTKQAGLRLRPMSMGIRLLAL
jgi:hypothetical protein